MKSSTMIKFIHNIYVKVSFSWAIDSELPVPDIATIPYVTSYPHLNTTTNNKTYIIQIYTRIQTYTR
jgi:hypothetical protein